MKINKCPKCKKSGFLVFRHTKYKDLKYPYVGHYDSTKKSSKRWCYIEIEDLTIQSKPNWQIHYDMLIKKWLKLWNRNHSVKESIRPLKKAAKLLEKNGHNQKTIWKKLESDMYNNEMY